MKYAALTYSSNNIGDDFQTIVAMRLMPRVDLMLDRDHLDQYRSSESTAVIMNGWFTLRPEGWPPSPSIAPIFVGFHMTDQAANAFSAHRDYFLRHSPVGCRDHETAARIAAWKVPSFVSYCLTLTLPRRERPPRSPKTVIVDADKIYIPRTIRRRATTLKFSHLILPATAKTRLALAQDILDFYRDEVGLAITTRLHCALPCFAIGIPVIFFGSQDDGRIAIVKDLGARIYSRKLHHRRLRGIPGRIADMVDWSPAPVDLGAVPRNLSAMVARRIEELEAGGFSGTASAIT